MAMAGAEGAPARTGIRLGPPFRGAQLVALLRAFDGIALVACFAVGACLASGLGLAELLARRISGFEVLALAGLVAIWWLGTSTLRLYDARRALRPSPRRDRAGRGFLLGAAAGAYAGLLLAPGLLTPAFLGGFAGASLASSALRRGLVRLLCGRAEPGTRRPRRALVVGTGPRARSIARRIDEDAGFATRVIGFVDDDWPGMPAFRARGHTLACDFKNLESFLRDHAVDELVVALPLAELRRQRGRLLAVARSYGLTLRFPVSQLADLEAHGPARRQGLLLSVYHGGREGWAPQLKRLLDLVLGSVLLVAAAPLFAAIALLVKLGSPGPVFFAQERVGLHRRRFRMYKFRSMVSGAEASLPALEHLNETGGPTFKLRHDPRITRVGRWLRRASLDELPQLLNVIRGEMSLVGPRPLPVRDVEGFDDERHMRRFSVPPGLTGLWQVSGRTSLSFETWMELDLRYVDEWSLGLDLRILARTVPAVLSGEGAE